MQKRVLVRSSEIVLKRSDFGKPWLVLGVRHTLKANQPVRLRFEAAVIVQYPLHWRPLIRNNSGAKHVENDVEYS
jgi:hypothetical protein